MQVFGLVLLLLIPLAQAQTSPRSNLSCGYLTGKVFCFFGFRYTGTTEHELDNTINVLDLTNATGKTSAQLAAEWKPVSTITTGVDISPRQNPQGTEMGDGKRMFFNGGYSPVTKLVDQTIIYDAEENKWSKYEPYTEAPYGVRQMYYGSALPVPGKGIALYGGFEEFINNSWTTPSTNVAAFNFPGNVTRTIGFTQVAFFDVDKKTNSWSTPLSLSTWASWFPNRQKSVFDSVNNQILFIGGEAFNNDPVNYKNVADRRPLSMAWAFSTQNSSWSTFTLVGEVPNGTRLYHSLDLAPKTKRDVIMFGGETDDGHVADDYCYILNLDTRIWKKITIEAPVGTALSRTEHSTVLTNNETMLVVWGLNSNRAGINSVLILNISDPYAITFSDKYVDPAFVSQAPTSKTNGTTNQETTPVPKDQPGGLSGGVIGGIVAACVVLVIGVIALCFFFYRKKNKKHSQDEKNNGSSPYSPKSNTTDETVQMEVDWENIEGKYYEVPPKNFVKNTATLPDAIMTNSQSGRFQSPDSKDITVVSPDSYDGINLTHLKQSPIVMKPDGSTWV